MTLLSCNDHKNAAVVFVGPDCPLCEAVDYYTKTKDIVDDLKVEIDDLKDEITTMKERE